MNLFVYFIVFILLSIGAYWYGRRYSLSLVSGDHRKLHSLPQYYGYYVALWTVLPACLMMLLWLFLDQSMIVHLVSVALPEKIKALPPDELGLYLNDVVNLARGNITSSEGDAVMQQAAAHYQHLWRISHVALGIAVLGAVVAGAAFSLHRIQPDFRSRPGVERLVKWLLIISSSVAILTTVGIVLSVLFEAIRFFRIIPLTDFLFGLQWSPQMAIREDQVGASGAFGVVPLFAGTILIALIAMLVAVPVGLMSAIYLVEFANSRVRAWVKPLLEILAGIPTVVYGFFAALVVAPALRGAGESVGLQVSSESALAAGLVMGIMIIPFVSSLSDDVINAVPQAMRDGSYALGATRAETISRVVVPSALPGIVGGVLLAVSRAIGETMIVVMAAGLTANLTVNPLDSVTTITVQIVTLLVGDQEFDSPKTLAAFALGLVLFIATLLLNVLALHMVRKYREEYE
ncbi:phosphate ABC transporter permease subunit PstC [Thiolapillus brandeum]|uniref:Phosphate transport system permease protein n=1 Tax=Thiolapillus brandeum TaxID=1076588 RepID=A0A7U6GKY7_9GAMM|nr:phosphate ABC transporter permease subunit PstC [Thiolapillus brandeum]BAO45419.1 phosphate ABC transporter permease [Thiolapillus brandeum]